MTKRKRRSVLQSMDEDDEETNSSETEDSDDEDSDEEVVFVNKTHPNNNSSSADGEEEDVRPEEEDEEELTITKRSTRTLEQNKAGINVVAASSAPSLLPRSLSISSSSTSSSSASSVMIPRQPSSHQQQQLPPSSSSSSGLAEILALQYAPTLSSPSRRTQQGALQTHKSPPTSPSRRISPLMRNNVRSPRRTPANRSPKTPSASIVHRRTQDTMFDASQITELSPARARIWLEPSQEQQTPETPTFEKRKREIKKKGFVDSDSEDSDETATHDGSDESDDEEERTLPYNIFPEVSTSKFQKTLFEELEFEDEYARWEHENEIEDIERETEKKEVEREAKELADWEDMKKKHIEFHLARIQSDMKKLADHFKEDDYQLSRKVELSPVVSLAEASSKATSVAKEVNRLEEDKGKENDEESEKKEDEAKVTRKEEVEVEVDVEGEERSKQSPLSSTDDNVIDTTDNRPATVMRPSTSVSSSLLVETSTNKPYLSPPSIHSLSMPSMLPPFSHHQGVAEVEKRFSTLDLSANNSHLIDLPLSGTSVGGLSGFSPQLISRSDSPSMSFGIAATTRFSSVNSAEASSAIANHVESSLFNMVELMHKEFSTFPTKLQKINDRLEAKSLQLAQRREKALELLFKPKESKDDEEEEDDDRDYLSFSEEEAEMNEDG